MNLPEYGPSGNAWGVALCDPVMVSHDSRLVVFARARNTAMGSIYYTVKEPGSTDDSAAKAGWNGWYRYDFPEVAYATQSLQPESEPVVPELRLAGMDLITVPQLAVVATSADAAFRVLSDGSFLAVFRQTSNGRLYMNRLALVASSRQVGGESERQYTMEGAFELRFRRSGLRDVPADDTDVEGFLDPIGLPFREPTIELPAIVGVQAGQFAVASSATADPNRSVLFIAVVTSAGVALHRLVRDGVGVVDLSEPPKHYTPLTPSLRAGGAALLPLANLAPGLVVFAEHDAASTAAGQTADLMRGIHLMVALPVTGGGLASAMATYDFALDVTGNIADVPTADQTLVLVDGDIVNGAFVPDTTAPAYPKPADLAATVQMIGGLTVASMVLGQVQAQRSPLLTTGDDGLLHLYFGGPLPGQAVYEWSNLDPNLPQAMVAQFDARVNRLQMALPWVSAAPSEQPNGVAQFVALQAGAIMTGATISVTDPAGGLDAAALCDVNISYPAATSLPTEAWSAVPRELGAFMAVLNGQALGDSAAPDVLSGKRPYFDASGTLPVVRTPVALAAASMAGPNPALLFTSTRGDLGLTGVDWSNAGSQSSVTFHFKADGQPAIQLTWSGFPGDIDGFDDVFAGVAAPNVWDYPQVATDTPLFALETTAPGIDAPIVFYPKTGAASLSNLSITVVSAGAETVTITFDPGQGGARTVVANIAAKVDDFAKALLADSGFQALHIGLSIAGAAGLVRPTAATTRMGVKGTAALFDLVMPVAELVGAKASGAIVKPGSYSALQQCQKLTPPVGWTVGKMAGFLIRSPFPAAGALAYVQNSTLTQANATRPLFGSADLRSGSWARQDPPVACAFDPAQPGSESMTVPVLTTPAGSVRPDSVFLQPAWDWTLEAWIKPASSDRQRVITFLDAVTPIAAGAPQLAYSLDTDGQEVLQFSNYTKTPGAPDSSFLQTLTSVAASFMPSGAFTWECWLNPDDVAGPASAGPGPAPLGGIIQVGAPGRNAFLTIGLTADRKVVIDTIDANSVPKRTITTGIIPARDSSGISQWTHFALVGVQDTATLEWSLKLIVDGNQIQTVTGIAMQVQAGPVLVIGANSPDNASMFGRMAQLRYWDIERSPADIRRTFFASLTGTEPGLLGAWPLTGFQTTPPGQAAHNIAEVTGVFWDALLNQFLKQKIAPVKNGFFLSVVGSVAGLAPIEADALLASGRWNHIAMVYQAGGALTCNDPAEFSAGRYNWVVAGEAESLGPMPNFAIDAWVEISSGVTGVVGTIAARWDDPDNTDGQCYRFWINDTGELAFDIAVITDIDGTVTMDDIATAAGGLDLRDGLAHHVAMTFESFPANTAKKIKAHYTLSLFVDGVSVATQDSGPLDDISSVLLQSAQGDVTFGAAYAPAADDGPIAIENYYLLHGKLGAMRFWSIAPNIEELFPEVYPRHPRARRRPKLTAQFDFREQGGRTAQDSIGGLDARLSSSAMWSSLGRTSKLSFVANGALVGVYGAATSSGGVTTQSQFALGLPAGFSGGTGFKGQIAEVSLWDIARSVEAIGDTQFTPRSGSEVGLSACWTFRNGGADITGRGNDAQPTLAPARISPSDAPISNEGPYVRNVYGGPLTSFAVSAPGQIATGQFTSASDAGTTRQRAVLKRQFAFDPSQSPPRPIEVGELGLTYIGQVQTDPTLIGYIEGAPPVPSENLTRPYYLTPDNPNYMKYLDTSTISLVQQAGTTLSFSSSTARVSQVDLDGAFGLFGVKSTESLITSAPGAESEIYQMKTVGQAKLTGSFEIGSSEQENAQGSWTTQQIDTMGFSGDWEGFQSDPRKYLNPDVGRRFVPDNLGYALVESLTADLYAITYLATGAAIGTMIIPDPAIPPDRNILLFPMATTASKAGTLDGRIGLMNDPAYPNADIKRDSYYKPVQAYALADSIDRARQRAESFAAQFSPSTLALSRKTDLTAARARLPHNFDEDPADVAMIATPTQGLVNRFVWTADGGLHQESQATATSYTKSYSGNVTTGGGGGFHLEGEFFAKIGFAWSLDVMATHRLDIQVGKSTDLQQALSMNVTVAGEAFLRPFDPTLPAEYGSGKGAYLPAAAPGKVKAYRFLSFYLPPSAQNSKSFDSVIDPVWRRLSNAPHAQALRSMDTSLATWRILHRVTYIERVPPPVSSRPVVAPAILIRAPVNIEGNISLIRMINGAIPASSTDRTRLIVGNAVAVALNPAPTAPGVYPASLLEGLIPWWRPFLDRARPNAAGVITDPAAAALLTRLVQRSTDYCLAGYASETFKPYLL